MRHILKPITRPFARLSLRGLYQARDELLASLAAARKSHRPIRGIQRQLNETHKKCMAWEKWV